ncbi:MAG: RimK family alpha-L-glutamate ligase [Candidatus Bathyarchaeia archaeon]
MSIGLLYERSENDENGIKQTAEELGIDLAYIPFRKIAVTISKDGYNVASKGKNFTDTVRNLGVVLNRAQSKNRRLYAAHTMEAFGKKVINPSSIEFICYSKFRTLLQFWALGLPFPKTTYVPCDPSDATRDGRVIHNEPDIADLLQQEIGSEVVVKPDAGTHGKGIVLSKTREELIADIQQTEPSIINPVGVVGQELIEKWFYDLRIIVYKEKRKDPICHPVAMARAGLSDFRTNTFLGNLVFDAKLPQHIRETAVKCGKALSREHEAWVFALDAMIDVGKNKNADDETLKTELAKAAVPFEEAQKVRRDDARLRDFKAWNVGLEAAFKAYMSTEPYAKVKNIIEENVEANRLHVVFHEANSCPEFWENTRLIAGINVAVPLLKGAQSLLQ